AHVLSFDYSAAARDYDGIAASTRNSPERRRDAAGNAVVLHAARGELDLAAAARRMLAGLSPDARTLAQADWHVAQHGAAGAFERFVSVHERARGAEPFVVDAAHEVAMRRRAAREPG